MGPEYIVVFTVLYSFFLIQWTEILPKTLGVRHNRALARVSAVPLRALTYVFAPVVIVIQFLNRLFSGRKKADENLDVVGEISVLAHFAQSNDQISRDQERILSRALRLSKLTVREVMVKKADMKCLATDMSLSQALLEAHLHHHTRFPLTEGADADNIIGYVNFKDIVTALRVNPADPSLRGIARPVVSLGAEETVSVALGKLTSGYQHLALVRDRAGTVTGLITLENILESIVGDVNDEYDILPAHCYRLSDTRTLAGGGIRLEHLGKLLDIEFDRPESTLNEWLLEQFHRAPESDETVEDLKKAGFVRVRVNGDIFVNEAVMDRRGPSPGR